jgi:outer membrane protein assembly factor BamD
MTSRVRFVRPLYLPGARSSVNWPEAFAARVHNLARALTCFVLALTLTGAAACFSRGPKLPAPNSMDADKFLFDRGTEEMGKRHWLSSREYFKKLVDSYPQSRYRQDAKLGIGDTYLGENSIESNILAANEFKEFLTLFPLNPKADYAQYKMILAYSHQMLGADRDQTATQDTLRECDTFLKNRPNSALRSDVEKVRRQARDRLSESEYKVGIGYYRQRWYPGAITRLKGLLEKDPEYAKRDAAFFYLGEIYHKVRNDAEALPYYEKVVSGFEKSDYLKLSKRRISEIKATQQPKQTIEIKH